MEILHYVDRTGELSLPPIIRITYTIIKIYYPGEPVNIHIQSLIEIIQENNWVITKKQGKGKLKLFCGNGERLINFYALEMSPLDLYPLEMGHLEWNPLEGTTLELTHLW